MDYNLIAVLLEQYLRW